MGIIYLLCVAVMFSFGGTCAKTIGPFFSAEYITLFRFVFGVFFLFLLKLIRRQGFRADYWENVRRFFPWLAFGAISKALAYLTENYALTHGVSYGNILTQPAQMAFLTIVSVFMLKEKLTRRQAFFMVPCLVGVLLVSWNGRSISDFLSGNLLLTALFLISGVFAGCHVLAQKKVADHMDIIDSNLTMFVISAVIALLPTILPTMGGALVGVRPSPACCIAILCFGFITGIGFYLNAKAIPLVPLYMVPVIQSTMVLFSLIWGILFFNEQVTAYVAVGSALFVIGIIGVQVKGSH